MGRLSILLLLLFVAVVRGGEKDRISDDIAGFAASQGHNLIDLAASGAVPASAIMRPIAIGAAVPNEGDQLTRLRMGAGHMGRKMLSDKKMPHDPDISSLYGISTAQEAVSRAASGATSANAATIRGALAGVHATVGDSEDMYLMRSGLNDLGKRRLGERAHIDESGILAGQIGQGLISEAVDSGDATRATGMGLEATLAANDNSQSMDTLYHLGLNQVPAGRFSEAMRANKVDALGA